MLYFMMSGTTYFRLQVYSIVRCSPGMMENVLQVRQVYYFTGKVPANDAYINILIFW